jgi:hypothetical protein
MREACIDESKGSDPFVLMKPSFGALLTYTIWDEADVG